MSNTIAGLVRRVTDRHSGQQEDLDRLVDLTCLLGEILATFAVNRDRLQWTGEELRFLYGLEAGWRERADKILAPLPDASEERLAEAYERSREIPRDWGPDQECPFVERPRVVAFVRERDGRLTLDPAGSLVEAIDLVPWFETLLKNHQHDIAGRLVRLERERLQPQEPARDPSHEPASVGSENPAALAYEAYRVHINSSTRRPQYLLSWSHLSPVERQAWWRVVQAIKLPAGQPPE